MRIPLAEREGYNRPMIQFRCWYCRKTYRVADHRLGERIVCTCQRTVRVPKKSGGNSRIRTIGDWLIETILCGGGGAFLGALLGVFILSRFRFASSGFLCSAGVEFVVGLALVGFVVGTAGGIRGIEWIGRKMRDREQS